IKRSGTIKCTGLCSENGITPTAIGLSFPSSFADSSNLLM
ncbi:hypothetical protein VCHENC02_5977B, partial [Vibrio harveyi]